ncbi:MAG: PP2C family protein-serine/threonine phosphatase [Thermoproteus sp.]
MRLMLSLAGKVVYGELSDAPKDAGSCDSLSLAKLGRKRDHRLAGYLRSIKGPRELNEDSAAVAVKEGEGHGLVAVADGVGGLSYGDVASSTAICAVVTNFAETDHYDENWLADLFAEAHEAVSRLGKGATTLSVALIDVGSQTVVAGNVGDSPMYLVDFEKGTVTDLTPNRDERARYIVQAVGHKSYVGPHILKIPIGARGALLAVTDGIDDFLPDKRLYATYLRRPDRHVDELIKAVENKTKDNATAVALYFKTSQSSLRRIFRI